MIRIDQTRSYTATEILAIARQTGTKGKILKMFRDGQLLVEYRGECVSIKDGSTFPCDHRIRAFPSQQTL